MMIITLILIITMLDEGNTTALTFTMEDGRKEKEKETKKKEKLLFIQVKWREISRFHCTRRKHRCIAHLQNKRIKL